MAARRLDGHDIFISYSSDDIDFAMNIATLLENAGFSVWIAKSNVGTGDAWPFYVERNLEMSKAVVVIMTPSSRRSRYVQSEYIHAMSLHKEIFPILLSGEQFMFLNTYQYEDMRNGLPPTGLRQSFIDRIRNIVQALPSENTTSDTSRVRFDIVQGCVKNFDCDVLVLKYAGSFYGADAIVCNELKSRGYSTHEMALKSGSHVVHTGIGNDIIAPDSVLFIPTDPIQNFRCESIREFVVKSFEYLASQDVAEVPKKHIAMTIHGVGKGIGPGLDEREAFKAQLNGIVDCLPWMETTGIEQISIIEIDPRRVDRLKSYVEDCAREMDNTIAHPATDGSSGYELAHRINSASSSVPLSLNTPRYALIISDASYEDRRDLFNFGIQDPVEKMGLICEYAELGSSAISKEKMQNAAFIIFSVGSDLAREPNRSLYRCLDRAMDHNGSVAFVSNVQANLDEEEMQSIQKILYSDITSLNEQLREWLRQSWDS